MTKSLKHVQERFSVEFMEKSATDKKSILHLKKFNKYGTVWNLLHERTKTVSNTVREDDGKSRFFVEIVRIEAHLHPLKIGM